MTDEPAAEAVEQEQEERPTDYAPAGADLVVADPTDDQDVIRVLDRHDEDAILRTLEQQPQKFLTYEFPQGGQKVIDLSYEGVSEAIRQMVDTGKVAIRIDPSSMQCVTVEEDLGDGPEPCWQATVYAEASIPGREGVLYGQFGTFIQPKFTQLKPGTAERLKRDGKTVTDKGKAPNPFSRQTALGKAQRNALKLFIPTRIRQALIAAARKDPATLKTLQVGRGAEALADLPPPLTDERADAQKAEARAIFLKLREANPTAMLPALFHQHLTRAESSHERLDDLIEALKQRLEEAT